LLVALLLLLLLMLHVSLEKLLLQLLLHVVVRPRGHTRVHVLCVHLLLVVRKLWRVRLPPTVRWLGLLTQRVHRHTIRRERGELRVGRRQCL
jgi:hypothetical protein